MNRNKLIIGAATIAAIGGGTAGAIAATSNGGKDEQAVLADAAKRLGVGTDELRTALSKAEDAQLDAAVKSGKLTQGQADAIRARRKQDGTVLGFGPGGAGEHGRFDHHVVVGGPGPIADVAKALGISEAKLFDQLRGGKSLAAVAKANGKSLADVKATVKRSMTARLDADVKAGRITKAQRDEAVSHLDDLLDHLGDGPGPGFGGPGGPGFDHHGGDRELMADLAKALGISGTKLFDQLRTGKSLSAIAKAEGKSLADVKAAVKAAATDRLDAAVKAGDITKAQRDEEVAELGAEVAHLGEGPGPFGAHGRGGFRQP